MTTISASGKRALDEFIESLKFKDLPGLIVGVSNTEGEIYFKGCGTNVIRDPTSGEINPDSVLWICSQTKMVTALAALKLVDQGKIQFDTPLADYLPELRNPVIVEAKSHADAVPKPAQTVLTLKHLLNFSSGLFYPAASGNPYALADPYTSKHVHALKDPIAGFFQMIIGDLPGVPLRFEPGTDFVYGWSSDVLGFIIEKVSGMSLENFCKEHIFGPLGMTSSFYLSTDLRKNLVDLTFRSEDGQLHPWADQIKIIEQNPEKLHLHFGGVGLYSSPRDYLKLLRHIMQINAGQGTIITPIWKKDTIRGIFVPTLSEKGSKSLSEMVMTPGTQWGIAMAINTQDIPRGRKKGSAYWGGWAGTFHFIDPTTGIAVVLGMQVTPPSDPEMKKMASAIEELIYSGINSGSED